MLSIFRKIDLLEWRILATVALVICALAHPESVEGQRALELSESIVEDHTVALDAMLRRDGEVGTASETSHWSSDRHDRSWYHGHYYAGVAPGLSFLMVPVVAVIEPIATRAAPRLWHDRILRFGVLDLASVMFLMMPFAAATTLLVHRTNLRLIGEPRFAAIFTFIYAFATLAFYYSVDVNVWLIINFASWCFIYALFVRPTPVSTPVAFGLGLAAGLAVSLNYFAIALIPIFVGTTALRAGARLAGFMVLGFCVAILPLGMYHAHLFGSPLSTPYAYRTNPGIDRLMASGIQGFHPPSPRIALSLLINPRFGLICHMPLAIAALIGLKSVETRKPLVVFAAIAWGLVFGLVTGRYADYDGGEGGFGSRYLVIGLPFMWLLIAVAAQTLNRVFLEFLCMLSLFVSTLGAMFGPNVSYTAIAQFLLRGPDLASLRWAHYLLDLYSSRRPPISALGVFIVLAAALWLVWRPSALLTDLPTGDARLRRTSNQG